MRFSCSLPSSSLNFWTKFSTSSPFSASISWVLYTFALGYPLTYASFSSTKEWHQSTENPFRYNSFLKRMNEYAEMMINTLNSKSWLLEKYHFKQNGLMRK
jgi:hypothetical protein